MDILSIARDNLLSPVVLSFVLGLAAALARSELSIPEAAARMMSIYLLFSIGFKGGAEVARHGLGIDIAFVLGAGILLSLALPVAGFVLLRLTTPLSRTDAAAVAGHYGSISIVTFVAATEALRSAGVAFDGYMVAAAAAMEAPAIVVALWLASGGRAGRDGAGGGSAHRGGGGEGLLVEVLLNGSIVLLAGAFLVGWASGPAGLEKVAGFLVTPFQGVLCLFLLDMGLLAGRYLRDTVRQLAPSVLAAGLYMPIVGASAALGLGLVLGLPAGNLALLMTLAASASYIAVPAALRIALPGANPAIYLTLSLGVTFPFNLSIGIPVYLSVAEWAR